jgi:hypothetical protein
MFPAAFPAKSLDAGTPHRRPPPRTLLGLDPLDGELRAQPHLPEDLQGLRLSKIGFRGKYVDLS